MIAYDVIDVSTSHLKADNDIAGIAGIAGIVGIVRRLLRILRLLHPAPTHWAHAYLQLVVSQGPSVLKTPRSRC